MYSSAIAPHALFVLPYENNDDDCGSAAPLQDVAELRLPVFPLDDEDDDITPLLAAMPPHSCAPVSKKDREPRRLPVFFVRAFSV